MTPPTLQGRPPPLSSVLPPLILGTATFNIQYVSDPHLMPSTAIVARALSLGITAFDTSPYYGPSETILGAALAAAAASVSSSAPLPPPRSSLTLITKCGRIGPDRFDYSPAQVRYSVLRSLKRLHTDYLDLVYAHDVEFVGDEEVLGAVRELRRLRDEDRIVRYVGISGFPVARLVQLAEMIREKTGEGVDAVMSYGNFTVQNRQLAKEELGGGGGRGGSSAETGERSYLQRLKAAGVGVVLNASMLGMGLLTSVGIPPDPETPVVVPTTDGKEDEKRKKKESPLAKWHPSPPALRIACKKLAALAEAEGERLESVALRWSLAEWARIGALAGLGVQMPSGATIGPSVMGVTSVGELEETVKEWQGVLRLLEGKEKDPSDVLRQQKTIELVEKRMWPTLGEEWLDYSWASPDEGWVNQLKQADRGVVPDDDGIMAGYPEARRRATQEWHAAFG